MPLNSSAGDQHPLPSTHNLLGKAVIWQSQWGREKDGEGRETSERTIQEKMDAVYTE